MQLAQILYKRQDKTAQIHQHLPSTIYNELKHGKSPFWQDNALFASKAKINIF